MTITNEILDVIKDNYLTVEEAFILHAKYFQTNWLLKYRPADMHYNKLQREGYLNTTRTLTSLGRQFVESLNAIDTTTEKVISIYEDDFKEWWDNYPSTDQHARWPKTRTLRTSKQRAKTLYIKVRTSGVSKETLLKAVANEVAFRMQNSIKENQLRFMKNPATWLYNDEYENWIENDLKDLDFKITHQDELE